MSIKNRVRNWWLRHKARRYRSHIHDIEDTIATLEGQARIPPSLAALSISLRHPGSVEAKIDALHVEKQYYLGRLNAIQRYVARQTGQSKTEVEFARYEPLERNR